MRWNLGTHESWISGTDATSEGVYKYTINGATSTTSLTVAPWAINEPDGGWNENCVVLRNYGYIDAICSRSDFSNYVVEFECVSPRIMFQGACISTIDCLMPDSYCN